MTLTDPYRTTVREKLRPVFDDDAALEAFMAEFHSSPSDRPVTEARFTDFEARMDTRFTGLETRIDGLETRFDGLETRFDGLEARFDGLETRFDGFEARFTDWEGRLEVKFAQFEARVSDKLTERMHATLMQLLAILLTFTTAYMAIVVGAVAALR